MWKDQRGMTLAEMLVAMAIFVMAITSVISVVLMGQKNSSSMLTWGDQSQQMRLALNQMADDMAVARWDSTTPTAGKIRVLAYQPYAWKDEVSDPLWMGTDGWPGDLTFWPEVYVEYELTSDGRLIRTVSQATESGVAAAVYSRQVLVSGLQNDSSLTVVADPSTPNLISVRLRAATGGNRIAEIASRFYVPYGFTTP
ncbi:MAG TPA: prepilin-type N-terminal cleavage/methylation domain-containing protein [Symbiobacteriaceae bacterium]|nr:prepilin-type N-terminal cleavage/methylation domain-containing protein [Symbiobacteriaceae bacterium]